MLGFALLYVGAVLFLNGLWLLGKIEDREIAVINLLVGLITFIIVLRLAFFSADADPATVKAGALTLLFSFTYLWVAFNRYSGADGRGLGWFSLFVAITAVPVAIETLTGASTLWGYWFGLCWVAWAILWYLFFLLLARGKDIARTTGMVTVAEGVLTGWLPGYLLLSEMIS
ncbi:MAG: transporter [Gammaproteobacteria bacterium]|nr:MAG: transporter [Gammaproteobacteria bacterium]